MLRAAQERLDVRELRARNQSARVGIVRAVRTTAWEHGLVPRNAHDEVLRSLYEQRCPAT